ncbi:hypothetical protein [Corynebacterium minutissimum]|uniref:hypothetical protein n=1 Tax=Corynebacterium minutissimum TaxID=38301 RepID=UPI001EF39129|nr:hypothetical protein [Corynebacterium minutissimum]MCG7239581.1 hypothetical protein [Corynebacterium minutissimum]
MSSFTTVNFGCDSSGLLRRLRWSLLFGGGPGISHHFLQTRRFTASDEPTIRIFLNAAVAYAPANSPSFRRFHEHMQAAATNRALHVNNGFGNCINNATSPRLQYTILERVIQVVAAKPTAEHDAEAIPRAALHLRE